jgi:hypothetical protein
MDFPVEDKLKCIQRELVLRKNVYKTRVGLGKMKQAQADREIAIMEAIYADYALLLSVQKAKEHIDANVPVPKIPGRQIAGCARSTTTTAVGTKAAPAATPNRRR